MDKLKEELKKFIVECVHEELQKQNRGVDMHDVFNTMAMIIIESTPKQREDFREFLQMITAE